MFCNPRKTKADGTRDKATCPQLPQRNPLFRVNHVLVFVLELLGPNRNRVRTERQGRLRDQIQVWVEVKGRPSESKVIGGGIGKGPTIVENKQDAHFEGTGKLPPKTSVLAHFRGWWKQH